MSSSDGQYSTWRDYYLVIQGFFYGSQGVAYGSALFFAAYLRSQGVSEGRALTLQAVLLIPWYIKFLFGVLSDNVAISTFGRRKPYIFLAALLGLIGWMTLPFYSTFSILLLLSGIAASSGIALADASIDALAVDITPPNRRGSMQGVSWGFRAIGFGFATLFGGNLVDNNEWLLLFLIPGILSTGSSLLVLLFKERPLPDDFKRVPVEVYKKVFSSKEIQLTMIFQILSGAVIAIIFLLETFLSQEIDYNATDIGRILFVFAIGMFTGAILIGMLGDKFRLQHMITLATGLYMIGIAGIFVFDLDNFVQASIYFGSIGFINGGYEATQMRLGMDYSTIVVGGTMFNLYNSISNIGQIAIGPLVVFFFIQILPEKVAWQIFIIFLFLALLVAIKIIRNYSALEISKIGKELVS